MKIFRRIAALSLLAAVSFLLPALAQAQVVTQLPISMTRGTVTDFGNGPLRFKAITGQAALFTSSASGVGTSAGTTTFTLAVSAAANPPCIGCYITCNTAVTCTIPANTTITAFNGTTGITTSVATTVTAQSVSWGVACPSSLGTNKSALLGAANDMPFWTQARICGTTAPGQPGAQVLTSAVNTVQ